MLKQENIICFGPGCWNWRVRGSCKRFMLLLAEQNTVLYVDPPPLSTPSLKRMGKTAFLGKVSRRLRNSLRPFRRPQRNLYVCSPFFLIGSSNNTYATNRRLVSFQVRILQKILSLRKPIVWIENPAAIGPARDLSPALILYYKTDRFESSRYLNEEQRRHILSSEIEITAEADVTLCVSSMLHKEKLGDGARNVHYVPHGVDFDHFNRAIQDPSIPDELRNITHPIIGYFGTLSEANDEALIHYCSERRPDFSFVLIGDVGADYQLLRARPNVYFLGHKDYEVLPSYAKAFDVCIMFWKVTEWIEHCNPVKTMEYLAMGKPVVSVAIDEISRRFDGIVSVAGSYEDFLAKIDYELATNSPEKKKRRIEFVRNETWRARAEQISRIIENAPYRKTDHRA